MRRIVTVNQEKEPAIFNTINGGIYLILLFFFIAYGSTGAPYVIPEFEGSSDSTNKLLLMEKTQQEYGTDGVRNGYGFPPIWDVPVITGNVHGIIVMLEANTRVNDTLLNPGDYIGGFYTDDFGELRCGGAYFLIEGENIIFSLFADDPDTPEKDGFGYAETIHFKLFSWTTLKEYDVDVIEFNTSGLYTSTNKWYPLGLSQIVDLQALVDMDFYINVENNPICIGNQLYLSGEEFIGSGGPYTFEWTSEPPGFYSTLQVPPPTTPSETTSYSLSVYDGLLYSDQQVTIIVNDLPQAFAGSNGSVCGNESYSLNGTALHHENIMWASSGDGVFDDPVSLSTFYSPGNQDIQNGITTITLIAHPLNPCLANAEDELLLQVLPLPIVDPGEDMSACGNDAIFLDCNAQYYNTIEWTTSGDGEFSNPNETVTQYAAGPGDINNGAATLTVCAEAINPCVFSACDDIIISYLVGPSCITSTNMTQCESIPLLLWGLAYNNDGILWTTLGDGYFVNPLVINTQYIAGSVDRENGGTTITLNALPIAPCTTPATKDINITLKPLPDVDAGNTNNVCKDDSYLQLNASVDHTNNFHWEILEGDGTFDNANSLTAKYVLGSDDLLSGSFELMLIAAPIYPCATSESDTLLVDVAENPSAEIGVEDATICYNENYHFNQTVITGYSSLNWFTNDGGGTFINSGSPNPTYIPDPEIDYSLGCIHIGVTAQPISPCFLIVEDYMELCFHAPPAVDIGVEDDKICYGDDYYFANVVANHFSELVWFTDNGGGTFSDETAIDPVYYPNPSIDYPLGCITIGVTAEPDTISPCTIAAVDYMELCFHAPPAVDIGVEDDKICYGDDYYFANVVANHFSELVWFTDNGGGTFSDETAIDPVYYPNPSIDYPLGCITIGVTAEPDTISPCTIAAVDYLELCFQAPPEVDAGNDITACGGELSGSVTNFSGILWETNGDGSFSDSAIINPIYNPGPGDISNLSVELTISAQPLAPCSIAAFDMMTYYIDVPQIVSDEVSDTELFTGSALQFVFEATSHTTGEYSWYFNNEIVYGQNSSTLIINNLTPDNAGYYQCVYLNGCGQVESSVVLVQILENSTYQFIVPQGWSGISSYVMPNNPAMEDVFTDVVDDLVLISDNIGFYWPAQNINTLDDWSVSTGYKIKMDASVGLDVDGFIRYPSQELTIPTGWSYLPVNAICAFDVDELFLPMPEITMIKDIAQTGIYWPEYSINTLVDLYPGKAYSILNSSGSPVTLTYPKCDGLFKLTMAETIEVENPWNEVVKTPSTHVFGFDAAALAQFEQGDIIGAFNQDGYCAGVLLVDQPAGSQILVAFANDQITTARDGLEDGESVTYKVFRNSTNEEFLLDVTYVTQSPNNGLFIHNGISMIGEVEFKTSSIGTNSPFGNNVIMQAYPNPSTGLINVELKGDVYSSGKLFVTNINGQLVYESEFDHLTSVTSLNIDLSNLIKGVYYLRLTSDEFTKTGKIILE